MGLSPAWNGLHRNRQASSRGHGSGGLRLSSQLLKFLEEERGPHNNALESHLGSLQVQVWSHLEPRTIPTVTPESSSQSGRSGSSPILTHGCFQISVKVPLSTNPTGSRVSTFASELLMSEDR